MRQAAIDPLSPMRVLVVEDNPDDADLMVQALSRDGLCFTAEVVDTEPAFLAALAAGPDIVLCDHTLPLFSARRAFEILREQSVRMPVLIVSGTITDELAVEFMQQGASDYVLKDRLARLGPAVRNAMDRFRFESAAANANFRLEHLMEDLEVGAITTDLESNVVRCNDVAWRMLGHDSEAGFRAVPMLSHYVDPLQRSRLVAALRDHGRVKGFDVELKRVDGSTLWTTGEYRAVKDDTGGLVAVETLLVDSTDGIRAEQESKASRERLDAALHNAPIVVATIDHDLRFSFAGGTALERVGLDEATLVGASARELLKDRPDIVHMLERAVAGEEFVEEGEYSSSYFHVKFSPISTNGVHGLGAALVAVDITARREAEVKAEARAQQQAAARELAQEALNAPPISELAGGAVHLAASALGVGFAAVYELLPAVDQIRRLASVGYERQDNELAVTPGGLVEWLVQGDKPSTIDDFKSEEPATAALTGDGVGSTLAVAIRDDQRTFGILIVSARTKREWSEDEREFVEVMGKTLWVAVERQRLEDERRALIRRLVDAQEQERRRIAADVHDDAVQVMSAVTMRMHLLARQLVDPDQLALVSKLQSTVALSIERLRALLFELNPPALELHGLGAALATLGDEFQQDFGIVTELQTDFAAEPGEALGLAVYRIVQEGLINIHKHAHATHVTVAVRDDGGGLWASIEDDGVGFDPANSGSPGYGHMGLTSMRERAELAGGWWKLKSVLAEGTTIEFWIPGETGSNRKRAVA
jgi:PAS domain S-box-containing protein